MGSQPTQTAATSTPPLKRRSSSGPSNTPMLTQVTKLNPKPVHSALSSMDVRPSVTSNLSPTSNGMNGTSPGPNMSAVPPPPVGLSPTISPDLPNKIPEDLKPHIAPYIQRAIELSTREPVMCYWCLFFAAKQGIVTGNKDSRSFLFGLMETIEKIKNDLKDTPAVVSDEVGAVYVMEFANKVFTLADNEEQTGIATRSTAKKFLAAANFFELLSVFDTKDESEVNDKIRYSKWRAGAIAKEVRDTGEATHASSSPPPQTHQSQNGKSNIVSGTQGQKPTLPLEQSSQSQFLSVPHLNPNPSNGPLPSPIPFSTFSSLPASGTATPHRPHVSPNAAERIPLPLSPQAPNLKLHPTPNHDGAAQAKTNVGGAPGGTNRSAPLPSGPTTGDPKLDGREPNSRGTKARKQSSAEKPTLAISSKFAAISAMDVDAEAPKSKVPALQKASQPPEGEWSKHATPGQDGTFKRSPGYAGAIADKSPTGPSAPGVASPPSSASKSGFGLRTTPIPPSPSSSTHTPQTSTFPLSTSPSHPLASGETGGKKLLATAPPGSTLPLERERRQSFRKSEPYVLPNVGLVVPPSMSLSSGIGTTGNKTVQGKDESADVNEVLRRAWMKQFVGPHPLKFPLPASATTQSTQAPASVTVSAASKLRGSEVLNPQSISNPNVTVAAKITPPEIASVRTTSKQPSSTKISSGLHDVPAISNSPSKTKPQPPSQTPQSEKLFARPISSYGLEALTVPSRVASAVKKTAGSSPNSSPRMGAGVLDEYQRKSLAPLDLAKKSTKSPTTPTVQPLPFLSRLAALKKVHFSASVKGGLSSVASNSPPSSPKRVVQEVTVDIPINGAVNSSTESTESEDEGKHKDEDNRTVRFVPPGLDEVTSTVTGVASSEKKGFLSTSSTGSQSTITQRVPSGSRATVPSSISGTAFRDRSNTLDHSPQPPTLPLPIPSSQRSRSHSINGQASSVGSAGSLTTIALKSSPQPKTASLPASALAPSQLPSLGHPSSPENRADAIPPISMTPAATPSSLAHSLPPPQPSPSSQTVVSIPDTPSSQSTKLGTPTSYPPTPYPQVQAFVSEALSGNKPVIFLTPEELHEARKRATYAMSALEFEDVVTARRELKLALAALRAG